MKKMRIPYLLMLVACVFLVHAEAATNVTYEASDSPGNAPDGNSNSVDVWTVTGDDPGRCFLQANQDGATDMWGIWDLSGGNGTYATHTFDGGALAIGQSVSIDYAHNTNIDGNTSIGIRFMDGSSSHVEFVFIGDHDYYSRYDTASGIYTPTAKHYNNYDICQLVFTLTGTNSYTMTVTSGSDPIQAYKSQDDGNPDIGEIIDRWSGGFTGSAITGIQVYTEGGNSSDQWFDNLAISKDAIDYSHDPAPAVTQEDVPVSGLELSWVVPETVSDVDGTIIADPRLASFDVYYTTEPNFANVTPVNVTGWDAQTLRASYVPSPTFSKDSRYIWRVDSVLDDGTVLEGDIWFFDTEMTIAKIESGPVNVTVEEGSTATFSVQVASESAATYQWYYVDTANQTELITGATTDTLSIANAQITDEGRYYCVVNNATGIEVTSDQAILGIKRMIAHWPFENNDLNSVVAGSPATIPVGDPNFVAGISGDAIEFVDGTDFLYTDPQLESYFDICNDAMTVACWVKTNDNQGWCAMVARNGEADGWQLRQNGFTGDRHSFTTRGTAFVEGTPASVSIYDDQWHYVVATFDGYSKKLYLDGKLNKHYSSDTGELTHEYDVLAEATESPVSIIPTDSPLAIGNRVGGSYDELDVVTDSVVAGLYDEVAIYNYALDAETIAQNYADVTSTSVCLEQASDLNNDCTVDLDDFVALASQWLTSGLVTPTP